jgi:fumarate reductase subunit D
MIRPHRSHSLWYAFLLHRLSGIGLALFLPIHFYMLALALTDPAQLDGFLAFTDLLIVKCAEFGLGVFAGGSYVWRSAIDGAGISAMESAQKTFAATAVALAFFISTSFFLQAM